MEDSLKKRYSIKLFANIITGIIGVILVAIVPKALGPAAYGHFVYLQSFFAKAISFLDMGSSTAFFTKLSARHARKELITFYFMYSFALLALLFVFVYSVKLFNLTGDIFPGIPAQYAYYGLFYGFSVWITQVFIKISDAYALTASVEIVKIVHKIFSLLLLLFFIYKTSFDLEGYFYFHYIAFVSFLFIAILLFVKKGIFTGLKAKIENPSFIVREFIDYCHPLVIYSIVGLLAGFFDIWLLQTTAGSEQTGFYGLAYSIAAICFIFTGAMTPIITREFSRSYEKKDMEHMRALFFRYIPMLYSIAAYFGVFIAFQSENLLSIFTDEKFKDAYAVLVIMAFYPINQTYGQLSGSVFYATGQTKMVRNIALFTQPLGMLLSFVFIYLLGLEAVGLAAKMIIGQSIGVTIQLYFNSKLLELNMKHFLYHQIYAILFFIVLAYAACAIVEFDSSYADFLFSGMLYTLLVIIFTYIFPQVFAIKRSEIKENLSRLKDVVKN